MCIITLVMLFGLLTSVLAKEFSCLIVESPETLGRSDSMNLWPGGVVPYTLDNNVAAEDRPSIQSMIENYATRTCIKIRPRQNGDRDWVHIRMNSSIPADKACGLSPVCRQGTGAQEIQIVPNCFTLNVLVHEMGHAICLHHEHARVDRDQFLNYSKCTDASKIEKINDIPTNRGYLFDYTSQMHYGCRTGCPAAKFHLLISCDPEINHDGLSVLDADKLNAVYDCKGCHSHRWHRVDSLSDNANSVDVAGGAVLCRGYVRGHIYTGTYDPANRACPIAYLRKVYLVTTHIQVLGTPEGQPVISNDTGRYKLVDPVVHPIADFVAVGRSSSNTNVYAAALPGKNGGLVVLGWAMKIRTYWQTNFAVDGKHLQINVTDGQPSAPFNVIACLLD